MKRFFLGMVVGSLVVAALWSDSRARSSPTAPRLDVAPAAYGPDPLVVVQRDPNAGFPPVRDGRESVGDIPVPILPGTRVTEAEIRPPQPVAAPRRRPRPPVDPQRRRTPPAIPAPATVPVSKGHLRVITGRLSATDQRAREDVRKQVDEAIRQWLAPEVFTAWQPPADLRESLVRKTEVRTVQKELDGERVTLFEASQTLDFSPAQRLVLVETYHRQLVARRLAILAGVIAFILSCLAALAGYIRADEATKGYYTNRLRLVSAAGVGAAGVAIYQLLV